MNLAHNFCDFSKINCDTVTVLGIVCLVGHRCFVTDLVTIYVNIESKKCNSYTCGEKGEEERKEKLMRVRKENYTDQRMV